MNKHQYFGVAACCLLSQIFLSGCAQYQWQKYGATPSDFNRDSYACQTEAARTFPTQVVTQQTTPGYTTPSTINCHGTGSAYGNSGYAYGNSNVNCTTIPGQHVPAVASTVDVNADNRTQLAMQCMYARGWQLAQVAQPRNEVTPSPGKSVNQWVRNIAGVNHCTGTPTVIFEGAVGPRETYKALCPEKEITVICEFNGPIHVNSQGFPNDCWLDDVHTR